MFMYKKKIWSVALVLLLASGMISGCSSSQNASIAVVTATVQKQSIETTIPISGVLLPQTSVVLSSKSMSEAKTVCVQVGDKVKKGQTLIVLDTAQLKAQLAQARAALKQAQASAAAAATSVSSAAAAIAAVQGQANLAKINYDTAKASYDVIVIAHDGGTASDADVQQAYVVLQVAQTQYNNALASVGQASASAAAANNSVNTVNAAVEVAQANINIIYVQIKAATFKAPIDGIVTNRNINPGELATAGAQLMTIIEQGSVKLKGTVSQSALPLLSAGQSIDISVDIYPDRTFTGVLSLIAPMAITSGEYFPIEITIAAADELKPGMSAHAQISVKSQLHLSVPASAVITESGQSFVFVIQSGLAKKVNVVAGITNGTNTEILSGLNESQEIIVSQANILKENMPVNKQ